MSNNKTTLSFPSMNNAEIPPEPDIEKVRYKTTIPQIPFSNSPELAELQATRDMERLQQAKDRHTRTVNDHIQLSKQGLLRKGYTQEEVDKIDRGLPVARRP